MSSRDLSKKSWKKSDEHLLEEWSDHGKTYRWMHEQARLKYAKKNAQFQIPVIILSTITGAANFAQERVPQDFQGYYSLIVGFLNIFAGVIATIQTFLKVSELLEGHRVASMSWGKYYHNVKTELQKHPDDRDNVVDFMKYAKIEYEKLVEQSPPIPPEIIGVLKEQVKKSGIEINLPPIVGVFDKFKIADAVIGPPSPPPIIGSKEKTEVEKVLEEINNPDESKFQRRTSKGFTVSSNFVHFNGKKDKNLEQEANNFLSNKLISTILSNTVTPTESIEDRVRNIVDDIPIEIPPDGKL